MKRKYDITCKNTHERLWSKWQLDSIEFFNYKYNYLPDVPEEEEEAADITYYQVLREVA